MSWEDLRIWGLYVVFGMQILVQGIGWVRRRALATPEQLAELRSDIQHLARDLEEKIRVERGRIHDQNRDHRLLEQVVQGMPDHDDLQKLHTAVANLNETTGRLSERVQALDRTTTSIDNSLNRVEQHLLDTKRNP